MKKNNKVRKAKSVGEHVFDEVCTHAKYNLTIVGFCSIEEIALIQCDKCESMRTAPFTRTYDYGAWKESKSF